MFLFPGRPFFRRYLIKFKDTDIHSPKDESGINLFYLPFKPFSYLNKNFTISTKGGSFAFNVDMMKNTSSIIYALVSNDSTCLQFKMDIECNNIMEKFERLYQCEQVSFVKSEYFDVKKIVEVLDIHNFPTLNNEQEEVIISIDEKSIMQFLQCSYQDFEITTNKNSYKCNTLGVKTSKIIQNKNLFALNSINKYVYNFEDENNEFSIIKDFFNFNSIQIGPKNMNSIKTIAEDLQIECLLAEVNKFIGYYEFSLQKINNKLPVLDSIEEVFQLLHNRENLSVETVKDKIINSMWTSTEENVQELVAFFIQVIYSDVLLHPFLLDLVLLIDQNKSQKKHLQIFLPFLVSKLMIEIGINMLNCAFIFRLHKKEIITKEEIADKIYSNISISNPRNSTTESDSLKLVSQYLERNNQNFDSERKDNSLLWFFPELIEVKKLTMDYINRNLYYSSQNFIQTNYKDNMSKFKEMRESGEPDDKLTKALRHDDIDELSSLQEQNQLPQTVPFNIFESFVNNESTSLLNYAAAYGAIKCFKYLLDNQAKINFDTFTHAIFGENNEIIELVDRNFEPSPFKSSTSSINKLIYFRHDVLQYSQNFIPPKLSFESNYCFYSWDRKIHPIIPPIIKHNNNLFKCILQYNYNSITDLKSMLPFLFENCNSRLIGEFIKEVFILNILSDKEITEIIKKSVNKGFFRITELIFDLIFNSNKQYLLQNPLSIVNFEDSISFGNLSILKLYASLNIKNIYFKDSLAIAIIRGFTNIVEYSLMYPFIQKYNFSTEDIRDLLKISIYQKKPNCLIYSLTDLGNKSSLMIIQNNLNIHF